MPRGVYARKSAQKAKPQAKAKPVVKKAAKPAVKSKATPQAKPKTQQTPKPAVQLVTPEFVATPAFYRNKSVSVDDISGAELKAYARSIGIMQRDVDGLTEDRLRQNCKVRIQSAMED